LDALLQAAPPAAAGAGREPCARPSDDRRRSGRSIVPGAGRRLHLSKSQSDPHPRALRMRLRRGARAPRRAPVRHPPDARRMPQRSRRRHGGPRARHRRKRKRKADGGEARREVVAAADHEAGISAAMPGVLGGAGAGRVVAVGVRHLPRRVRARGGHARATALH
ncbi:hypothetical protein BAE44_0009685, partial [Dichanthelium oligosanthes]